MHTSFKDVFHKFLNIFFPFHLSTWAYVMLDSGVLTRREFRGGVG